jgi:mono/diheme cytochrome c family protein
MESLMPDRLRRSILAPLLFVGCAGLVAALTVGPVDARPYSQDPVVQVDGRELFNTYCASCHGVTGAGNGPAAASLRRRPPDLSGLALANGGIFPAERLRRIIDGREVEAHGDRAMPVWGDAFKTLRGGHSEEAVRARIAAILKHLAAMQRRQA